MPVEGKKREKYWCLISEQPRTCIKVTLSPTFLPACPHTLKTDQEGETIIWCLNNLMQSTKTNLLYNAHSFLQFGFNSSQQGKSTRNDHSYTAYSQLKVFIPAG